MIDKEVDQFIRAFSHCQLENSCSNEAHHMLHAIESDIPVDVITLILGTREHSRSGWISQDSNLPGLYDMIWDRIMQLTEIN